MDKKQIAFYEFAVLAVNCAITVTNNEFVIFAFNKKLCKNKQQFNVWLNKLRSKTKQLKLKQSPK